MTSGAVLSVCSTPSMIILSSMLGTLFSDFSGSVSEAKRFAAQISGPKGGMAHNASMTKVKRVMRETRVSAAIYT